MKRLIDRIMLAIVCGCLAAAVIGVAGVYVGKYVLTAAVGEKHVNLDGDRVTAVDINYELDGIGGHVSVKKASADEYGINKTAGSMGTAIDIKAAGRNVESATISFKYDASKLSSDEIDSLGIAYYNEELGRMELLDSRVDKSKGTVWVKTSHFSEYVVVDTDEWYDAWLESQLIIRDNSAPVYFNINFSLDNSGSMSGEKNVASRASAYSFITQLYDEDMFSLLTFNSSASMILGTQRYSASKKADLKAVTDSIGAGGGTEIDSALEMGIAELCKAEDELNRQRLIVLLSDGQSSVNEDFFAEANENLIKIITIGFGSDADEELLKNIARSTGGQYYRANEKNVSDIFELIREEYLGVDMSEDSDGDGLPDKVEMMGMRNQFGKIVVTDPYNADTDGDGKSDGEEMGTVVIDENVRAEDAERGLTRYVYFKMVSHPLLYDGRLSSDEAYSASKEGDFPLTFSSTQGKDISCDFYYSDSFFSEKPSKFNKELAISSMGLTLTGFSVSAGDKYYNSADIYNDSGYTVRRENNIRNAYETLGFTDSRFYNYNNKSLSSGSDEVAYSFAHKTVKDENGGDATLIAIVVRGGGYGNEWKSNFNVGDQIYHEGFSQPSWDVLRSLTAYIKSIDDVGRLNDNIKFWVTGYSRGAAVANITAARLSLVQGEDSVYGYCFATPRWVNAQGDEYYTGKSFSGIYNFINYGDVVPNVAFSEWGFERVGKDIYFVNPQDYKTLKATADIDNAVKNVAVPVTDDKRENAKKILNDIVNDEEIVSYVDTIDQHVTVSQVINALYTLVGSQENYYSKYQSFIMDAASIIFTKEYDDDGKEKDFVEKFCDMYGDEAMQSYYYVTSDVLDINILMNEIGLDENIKMYVWTVAALADIHGIDLYNEAIDSVDKLLSFKNFFGVIWAFKDNVNLFGAHYPEVYLSLIKAM